MAMPNLTECVVADLYPTSGPTVRGWIHARKGWYCTVLPHAECWGHEENLGDAESLPELGPSLDEGTGRQKRRATAHAGMWRR